MKKQITVVCSVVLIAVLSGIFYVNFWGSPKEKELSIKYSIEYVSSKYGLNKDVLIADNPTYDVSSGSYRNKLTNKNTNEIYYINVKLANDDTVHRIDEYSKNPVQK